MRAYKTVNDTYIEPISFTVPRRAETFQSDIYPPATGLKPAMSAKEWLDGKTALPPKIDLESVYEGTAPVEVPADYKPPPPPAASTPPTSAKPAQKEFEAPKPAPAARAPPPSGAEQKASISAMANKYKEQEESSEEEDEASSFEEVSRPAQRGPAREETKPIPRKASPPPTAKPAPAVRPTPAAAPAASPSSAASAGSGEVSSSLREIKEMMQAQQGILKAQSEQIGQLTQEVETLRRRVGSGGSAEQSERIRQLELELEAARS